MTPKKLPYFLSILPGSAFMLLLLWNSSANPWGSRRFTLFDDAMISMDYAKTLATTGEFVWFPGAARVQGFTNPLWTLWMAVIHLVGLDGSSAALAVSITGVILLLATAWIAYVLVSRACSDHATTAAVLAAGSIPFMYPTVYWTLRGMEVGLLALFTLLLLKGAFQQATKPSATVSASVVLPAALGIATRFDFIVVCIVALVAMTYWAPAAQRRTLFVANGSFFVSCLAIVCGAQKLYWGTWFPNTYHLKIDGVHLIDRVSRGAFSGAKALVLVVLLLAALLNARSLAAPARRLIELSAGMFFAMSLYAVYIGGDAWEDQMLNRFFATALPLVAIAVVVGLRNPFERIRPLYFTSAVVIGSLGAGATVNPFGVSTKDMTLGLIIALIGSALILVTSRLRWSPLSFASVLAIALTVIAVTSGIPLQRQIRNKNVLGSRINVYVTEVVENLAATTHPDAVIATVWAGVPAYYSNRPMHDLLGKNDTRIAHTAPHGAFFPGHNKWDYNYSIGELRPDVIFQTFTRGIDEDLPARIKAWGYEKRCTTAKPFPSDGVYYRLNSTRINWNKLTQCAAK